MFSISSILAIVLLGATGCYAAPITDEKRSISSDLFSTLNLMEQYAAASYCSTNYDTTVNTKVECPAGNCPLVQADTTDTLSEFENSLITDVTGFVAVDNTNELVVVSFRGSASIKNWITDLDFTTVATDICSGCTAHQGFWNSWVEARSNVLAAVKSVATANPNYQVVAVGHSLGGAIAALAAAELRNAGYNTALYTFGSPRIAGQALSDYITNQQGGNYRVTHYNDPVPRLPPVAFGFVHISPEYYIDKPDFQTAAASDIRVYTGNVNYNGNGAWILTDILAHTWYFNSIAQCYIDQLLGKRDDEVKVFKRF
ncbi:putative extracellular lipase [Lepidopterella palustris CBS 459.81]|uniref:Putative extracellular lipase n=1 Tax=Lepidopterella palustris CBS 459.81 TaxID=1314670 RepID=A0A8E2JIM8_9PEZI|nr:putative extracellular lipase [Lepidopterella palustris CBS 459.81]